jgi:hypothetical protein
VDWASIGCEILLAKWYRGEIYRMGNHESINPDPRIGLIQQRHNTAAGAEVEAESVFEIFGK